MYVYLRGRVSGCVGCARGGKLDDHAPTYKAGSPATGFGQQLVIWPCLKHNFHTFDLLRGAGWIEIERNQHGRNGLLCRPDVTVLNTHYQPMAFLEVVNRSRPLKSVRVAEGLDIPLFEIAAPKDRTVAPGLVSSRRWWEVASDMPEANRIQMEYMEAVGDELVGRNDPARSGTFFDMSGLVGDDGEVYRTVRTSAPDLTEGRFPTAGGMIWAKSCSWSCKRVVAVEEEQGRQDLEDAQFSELFRLWEEVGRLVLDSAGRVTLLSSDLSELAGVVEPAELVEPLGSYQVRLQVSVEPLGQTDESDAMGASVVAMFREAVEQVERRRKSRHFSSDSPPG